MTADRSLPHPTDRHRRLRVMPAIRSAYIERFAGGPEYVTYFVRAEYLDPTVVDPYQYRHITRRELLRVLWQGDYDVLALPEPWWIAEAPYTTLLSVVARLATLFRGRRLRIVTYAIENAACETLLPLPPSMPRWWRRCAVSLVSLPYVLMLDRVAFGSEAARENYCAGLVLGLGRRVRSRSKTVLPLSPACECHPTAPRRAGLVLYLGPLEPRKGFDTLLSIWNEVVRLQPSARLLVCGSGSLQPQLDAAMAATPTISQHRDANRAHIHACLREAVVLVSLPRTHWRWREQIGLSVTEGLSHGCHIVTTRQTGLADWLERHGQTVVEPDAPPLSMAAALADAVARPRPVSPDHLPSISGRATAEWWMAEDARCDHQRETR
jgi:glycosyltransferase involved in cell wall biosynthesis